MHVCVSVGPSLSVLLCHAALPAIKQYTQSIINNSFFITSNLQNSDMIILRYSQQYCDGEDGWMCLLVFLHPFSVVLYMQCHFPLTSAENVPGRCSVWQSIKGHKEKSDPNSQIVNKSLNQLVFYLGRVSIYPVRLNACCIIH